MRTLRDCGCRLRGSRVEKDGLPVLVVVVVGLRDLRVGAGRCNIEQLAGGCQGVVVIKLEVLAFDFMQLQCPTWQARLGSTGVAWLDLLLLVLVSFESINVWRLRGWHSMIMRLLRIAWAGADLLLRLLLLPLLLLLYRGPAQPDTTRATGQSTEGRGGVSCWDCCC